MFTRCSQGAGTAARVGRARPAAYAAFCSAFTPDSVHTACAPHQLCTEHPLWIHQMKVSSRAARTATCGHFVPHERPPAQHCDVVYSASIECGATLSCSLASSTRVLPFSSDLEHVPGCPCAISDACSHAWLDEARSNHTWLAHMTARQLQPCMVGQGT
mgnify:CR=1 FL=1|jgi:hypothetical protein